VNKFLRIRTAEPQGDRRVRLILTDGTTLERDLRDLLTGPVFAEVLRDENAFRQVRVESGSLVWPNGADLCADALIWGGLPPETGESPPASLAFSRVANQSA